MTLESFLKRCEEVENTWMDDVVYEVSSTYPTLLKMLRVATEGWKLMASPEGWGAPGGRQGTAMRVLEELEALAKESHEDK